MKNPEKRIFYHGLTAGRDIMKVIQITIYRKKKILVSFNLIDILLASIYILVCSQYSVWHIMALLFCTVNTMLNHFLYHHYSFQKTVKKCKTNKKGKKKCRKVLKNKKCPKGQVCVPEAVPCPNKPCPYVGKCKPKELGKSLMTIRCLFDSSSEHYSTDMKCTR